MNIFSVLVILSMVWFLTEAESNFNKRNHIPHDDIPANETEIYIYGNNIPVLSDGEFSNYPYLHTLRMSACKMTTVSPSAFNGTILLKLWLPYNDLTQFPDLQMVSATLESLYIYHNKIEIINQTRIEALVKLAKLDIRFNPLCALPNFTKVGSTTWELSINNVSSFMPVTFCGFIRVNYLQDPVNEVPYLVCANNQPNDIQNLFCQQKEYNAQTDFSNLTSFVHPDFQYINLDHNNFHENFPDLPISVRKTIKILTIRNTAMGYISADTLANYSLTTLNVTYNKLTTVPLEAIQAARRLVLSNNPWQEFSATYWHGMLCDVDSQDVTVLAMSHNMPHLAYMRVLQDILCSRARTNTGTFKLYLYSIPVPCDCTIAWMLHLVQQCGVQIYLDIFPCNFATWDEVEKNVDWHLECPQNFAAIVSDGSTNMIETNSTFMNTSASLVYVHNSQCAVTTEFDDIIVLGPGTHIFADVITITSMQLFTNNAKLSNFSLPAHTCLHAALTTDPVSIITDGSMSMCLSLQHTSLFLTIKPHMPILTNWAFFTIITRHMDCRNPFHVALGHHKTMRPEYTVLIADRGIGDTWRRIHCVQVSVWARGLVYQARSCGLWRNLWCHSAAMKTQGLDTCWQCK